MARIAVVGAGLAGLVIARELSGDHAVTIFEKSGGVGGRMATRYAGHYEFDHGAQFFTARSAEFRRYLQPLIDVGAVASWSGRFAEMDRGSIISTKDWDDEFPHWVGVPRMNAIGKWLAEGLDVRLQTTVETIEKTDGSWSVIDGSGSHLGRFDWAIIAIPAAQAAALASAQPTLRERCETARMLGCCALMLGFSTPLSLPWQAALVRNSLISWVSVNSSKPGRAEHPGLVIHSTNAWAEAHCDDNDEWITERLLAEATDVLGYNLGLADFVQLQRWRYANIDKQAGSDYFADKTNRIAACGDWFIRGRIESAFASASQLLQEIGNDL